MQKFKIKIYLAGLSLLMALVMLVTASVAWFTISTAPEISGIQVGIFGDRTLLLSDDGEDFEQYIDLSYEFSCLAPLHPVSTVDGLNWYLPTYDLLTGALKDPTQFIFDNTLEYANVSILAEGATKDNPQLLTGDDLQKQSDKGYYVYADFWMMTEEEYGCNVRLSIPHYANFDDDPGSDFMTAFNRQKDAKAEVEQGAYGSYVLNSSFALEDGEVVMASREAETSMRVGFLLNPQMLDPKNENDILNSDYIESLNNKSEEGEGESESESEGESETEGESESEEKEELDPTTYDSIKDKFYIYEPNADRRSAANKPVGTDDTPQSEVDYIKGYRFNISNYKDDTYFVTQPIGGPVTAGTDTQTQNKVNTTATVVDIPQDRLIIQKASDWNMESLEETLNKGQVPNSNDVFYPMGGFLKTTTVYTALTADDANNTRMAEVEEMPTDIAGSNVIVTLKKDTPLKVRLFIWIEGQDVDCWNDIAAGRFIVNLELAGETLSPPADDTEST